MKSLAIFLVFCSVVSCAGMNIRDEQYKAMQDQYLAAVKLNNQNVQKFEAFSDDCIEKLEACINWSELLADQLESQEPTKQEKTQGL